MRNTISTCLLAIGVLILAISFISGITLANDEFGDFQIKFTLYWWGSGIISGFVFIGLAEIVNLLQKLLDKQNGVTQSIPSVSPYKADHIVSNVSVTSSSNDAIKTEESEIIIKDLTILIDDERVKGQFWITNCNVKVMKKSMLQSNTDAELVKVINKSDISPNYEKNKDYLVFSFIEGNSSHKLAFKTHNIYDYERIVNLLVQAKQ
ncbi:hypothetical protein [Paenibacillus sp. YIM B09110]|uniref:hypothetical protein n=1 Tax=Paenibacillus sp. YIM B09110 TaxID=3126102 RepID=UPI00301BE322